jgi:proline iminopeptidase
MISHSTHVAPAVSVTYFYRIIFTHAFIQSHKPPRQNQMSENGYPNSRCNQSGHLTVQEHPRHQIYWEEYGSGDGEPVLVMHGGPGAGCHKSLARFFNPDRYRVILFDQRGCGKSTPSARDDDPTAALTDNTTEHLIGDVLRLRRELDIHGKMHVFGGSWGSTLALAYAIAHPDTVQTLILRGIFLCRRADVDYFFQGNAADFALDALAMPVPGTYLDFPTAWQQFVAEIPADERGDVVKALAKIFAVPPHNEADLDRALNAASACVAWETNASRLNRDENSQSRPNPKYALTVARILVHYMVNGGFLGGDGELNRDNHYILDHVHRLKDIPMHIVHGRYDRVCHLYQAEALVRALRAVGNADLKYFITTAGHSSLEPETESRLCTIMNDLPRMTPFDRGGQ